MHIARQPKHVLGNAIDDVQQKDEVEHDYEEVELNQMPVKLNTMSQSLKKRECGRRSRNTER